MMHIMKKTNKNSKKSWRHINDRLSKRPPAVLFGAQECTSVPGGDAALQGASNKVQQRVDVNRITLGGVIGLDRILG